MSRGTVLLLLLLSTRISTASEIFPTFSEPLVAGYSLLVASPDSQRLVCLDRAGKVRWTKSFHKLLSFGQFDDRNFYAQDGRRVFRVATETGKQSLIITLPSYEAVTIDRESEVAWSSSAAFGPRRFVLRDRRTFRPLWRDDRVESVTAADGRRLYVLTTKRHTGDGGRSFTVSDAMIRALDLVSGREIWSHRLHDDQSFQTRSALVGRYLVIADGLMPTNLTVLDAASGAVARDVESTDLGSRGVFEVEAQGSSEALLLEAMRQDGPDRLTTVSIPDLRAKSSIPLPADENLVFFRDGDVIVTSGMNGAAAFDLRNGAKLWEIGHQLLLGHPQNGVLYASRSDRANDLAVLETIDLRTGEELTIYTEPLPSSMTAAARKRDRERWEKQFAERKAVHSRNEEKRRPPIGNDVCLRFDRSGMLDVREYWILDRTGKAEYFDADNEYGALRAFGRWSRGADGSYAIRGTPLVPDVQTEALTVTLGVKPNLALLPDLRDVIEGFVQTHAGKPATPDELEKLEVRAPGCPREAQPYCTVAGERILHVTSRRLIDHQPVSIEDLEKLIHAIDRYRDAIADADVIRFRLRSYRSYTFAEWIDPHSYWQSEQQSVEYEIDSAIDFAGHGDAKSREPALFRLAPCTDVAAALKAFPDAFTVP